MALKFISDKCIGCKLCHLACSGAHEDVFNPGLARLSVESYYQDKNLQIDGNVCTLCGECVDVCPTSAIELKEGRLHYSLEDCINCGVCVSACPEEVILQKDEGVGICDLCEGSPWCVKSCPHGALVYEEVK
ncbi:4Fe-4S dicluster domain-containing protein [Natronincola ferrireducens]|uniref:Fe-S-cluster-containing hydrogenase component 2 n=1 Tax=Natronincola ferrireducens TaxID=393762 RepID=A0A1G8YKH5_9FIRM|nr:4Fe-4S dicluster domain-containing protein [Natronincola ferrireducens]SDK03261.1 Fe-S-cluster-containing hydrogenase component 2 [Natronincola ferrireducens]